MKVLLDDVEVVQKLLELDEVILLGFVDFEDECVFEFEDYFVVGYVYLVGLAEKAVINLKFGLDVNGMKQVVFLILLDEVDVLLVLVGIEEDAEP